ncbi:DUF2079 domain-containing protein [Desulfurococcus amylolyticus]|uniref:DUF2079 domain-containing protein n=1 Tax=Desulfurococcus amylolyticus TaxID=94694 RepID=UPI0005B23639
MKHQSVGGRRALVTGVTGFVGPYLAKKLLRARILIIAFSVYVMLFSALSSLRHYTFNSQAFDLGIFIQLFWQTIHGNFWYVWPRASPAYSPVFPHISPLALLLCAIYHLLPFPYTLLTLQSVILALPTFYIYRIANTVLKDGRKSLVISLIYLLHPAIMWVNLYDFHLEAFIPLFFSMAFYYWLTNDIKKFVISFLLLISVFDSSVPIALMLILYVLIRELGTFNALNMLSKPRQMMSKRILTYIVLFVSSAIYFFLAESIKNIIWPQRRIYEPPIWAKFALENLWIDVSLKLSYLVTLLFPVAFLPLHSPLELLPALPYFAVAFLSTHRPYYVIVWQYNAVVIAQIFVATIYAMKKLDGRKSLTKKLIALTAIAIAIYGPINPVLLTSSPGNFQLPNPHVYYGHKVLGLIEPDASVLAQENIYPHLANRPIIHSLWPSNAPPPEYIVVDVSRTYFFLAPLERVELGGGKSICDQVVDFMERYKYGVIASADGFVLLRLNYTGEPKVFVPYKLIISPDQLIPEGEARIVTYKGSKVLYLPKGFEHKVGYVWHGPWSPIPPGNYAVKLSVEIGDVGDLSMGEKLVKVQVIWWEKNKIYAERLITADDFKQREAFIVLNFRVDGFVSKLEVVGVELQGKADLFIKQIEIEQVKP